MNVLFLGSMYPNEIVDIIRHNSKVFDYPGNILQHALIAGLDKGVNLSIITAPRIRGYKSLVLKSLKFSHNNISKDQSLFEIDIPALKELILAQSYYKAIRDIDNIDAIIIYSTSFQALYAASLYKKKHSSARIVNIITDLPEYMSTKKRFLYDSLKSIGVKLYKKYSVNIDGYILLAPEMRKRLPVGTKPWMQLEGIYFNNNINIEDLEKNRDKVILYTGNLNERYGILDLIKAFSLIKNDNYKLWLCGNGDSVEMIKEYQKKDNRILYWGSVARDEVFRLQKQATILVNPRHSTEEYTKYSFPSKTMEYMASGTPTLMSNLSSLPEEYKQYLYLFDDESVEGIKSKLIEVCEKPTEELEYFGKRASTFIINSKNEIIQCKRIIDFIKSL